MRDRQRGDALATEQRDQRNAEEIRREADDDRARERREVRQAEEMLGGEPGDAERTGRGPVCRGEHQARKENVQPEDGARGEADERGACAEHRSHGGMSENDGRDVIGEIVWQRLGLPLRDRALAAE